MRLMPTMSRVFTAIDEHGIEWTLYIAVDNRECDQCIELKRNVHGALNIYRSEKGKCLCEEHIEFVASL